MQHGDHVADQRIDLDRLVFQRELAGLDLGQVQHRIDELQQVFAGYLQLVQPLRLLLRQAGAAQQIGHARDRVERRADLVRHVGQKGALGDVCGFRRLLGQGQRLLGLLARSDVGQEGDEARRVRAVAGQEVDGGLHRHRMAIPMPDLGLETVVAVLAHQLAHAHEPGVAHVR